MDAVSWREQAACTDEDTEMFFSGQQEDEAQAVCARCPVRQPCRAYAFATRQRFGVWGGMTEDERLRALRTAVPTDDEPLGPIAYTTRARSTGATCSVRKLASGDWGVVCESHYQRGASPSRTAAGIAVSRPQEWCPDCRLIRGNKLPRVGD